MQDRFKFRYNYNNKIYDVFAIDFFHSTGQIVSLDRKETLMCKLDLNNLIQCTGLKDKNGKFIYEGDIVQFYDDGSLKTMKIVWDDDEFDFKAIGLKKSVECYGQDFSYLGCIEKENNLEVIGNIYENPELLEVENER